MSKPRTFFEALDGDELLHGTTFKDWLDAARPEVARLHKGGHANDALSAFYGQSPDEPYEDSATDRPVRAWEQGVPPLVYARRRDPAGYRQNVEFSAAVRERLAEELAAAPRKARRSRASRQ